MSLTKVFHFEKKAQPLYLACFFNSLVFFAPVALLVRTRCGITTNQFFILQAISALAIFALEIPCGFITDRIGYKKSMIITQVLLCAFRLQFLLGGNFFCFALSSIIEAFSICFESGTLDAYYYTIFGEDGFVKHTSIAGNFATVAFIISTLAFVPLNQRFGITGLLFWTFSSHIVALCFALLYPDDKKFRTEQTSIEQSSKEEKKLLAPKALFNKVFTSPALIAVFLVSSFMSLGSYIVNFFFIVKLEECGINENWISAIILGYSALLLSSPLILKKVKTVGSKKALPFLFALVALLLFAISFSKNILVVIPMLLLPLAKSLPSYLLSEIENKIIDNLDLGDNRASVLSVLSQGANLCDVVFLFLAAAVPNVSLLFLSTATLFAVLSFGCIVFRR